MPGFDPDVELMRTCGIDVVLDAGCCGLAGNIGFERGHDDVSVACAEATGLALIEIDQSGEL